MLDSSKLMAFVATNDAKKARHFYQTVLGLSFVADEPFALTFNANGVMVRITKVEDVSPRPYTVLGWSVQDIKSTVEVLLEGRTV
jgi:catechol 2,3-dioxygenase-like lactoylglutathione lyase family enzyme